MITLSRRQARKLRAVFRRHALGFTQKGLALPLSFLPDPVAGLRVRHHQPHLAVECLLRCVQTDAEPLSLPLDALADLEGAEDSPITLERTTESQVQARWEDRGIPQTRSYTILEPGDRPPFPEPPGAFETCSAGTLNILTEAAATTDSDSTRYALGCLQFRGRSGEVIATDGRQILIQGGFHFPWDEDLLISSTSLFGSRGLPRDLPVSIGKTDSHVVLRTGDWTMWLSIRTDARYPRIAEVIPDEHVPASRFRLAPEDAAFLDQALDRLPGGEGLYAPVTLDLNGRVSVRARADDNRAVTELVLVRSLYGGEPVQVSTSRHFLSRAVRLGFTEVQIQSADDPVVCRDSHRIYLWQPLSKDSVIEPADDAVRIDSTAGSTSTPEVTPKGAPPMSPDESRSRPPTERPDRREHPRPAERTGDHATGPGLAALIPEALEIQRMLIDLKRRTGRLVVALRRERKRSRLLSNTLETLRQLRLQETAD